MSLLYASNTLYTNKITYDGGSDGGIIKTTYKEISNAYSFGSGIPAGPSSLSAGGFTITHTPTTTSSKFLIGLQLICEVDDPYNKTISIVRTQNAASNYVDRAATAGNRLSGTTSIATSHGGQTENNTSTLETATCWVYDSFTLTNTNPITYTVEINSTNSESFFVVNRTRSDSNNSSHERAMSWMQVWEVSS